MAKRDVSEVLLHRFLTEYGYDHGPVIAKAIVQDILKTIESFYAERVPPKTVTWLAVRVARGSQRKGLDVRDLIAVRLQVITEEEMALLSDKQLRAGQQARSAFNRHRFARWCFEAYEQGGVLTFLDMAMLSGLSEKVIRGYIHEYEAEQGCIVPTRGTVHDIGPSVTHKAEVVRRWLRHESPAAIAKALHHSQEAVDRYLADFQRIRLLVQHFPLQDIPVLAGMAESVVAQYVALLQQYEPVLSFYQQEVAASSASQIRDAKAAFSSKD